MSSGQIDHIYKALTLPEQSEKDKNSHKALVIGNFSVASNCVLAPLSGISDLSFRIINRRFGCRLAFTEMISARSLVYDNKRTTNMLLSSEEDCPLGVQLLGNDPNVLLKALEVLSNHKMNVLDLNAACPVSKVTHKGEGAALMRDPKLLHIILKSLATHSCYPVTVKIRSGWDENSINAVDIALLAEDAGIHGLVIHGRTREQGYSGHVDYSIISEVKKRLTIPVIASGDALNPLLVKKMFDETGCDGIMIARGALGNPWIFRQTEAFLSKGELIPLPSSSDVADIMGAHLEMLTGLYGTRNGTIRFRKFFSWYSKGFCGSRELKNNAFIADNPGDMGLLIRKISTLKRSARHQEAKG